MSLVPFASAQRPAGGTMHVEYDVHPRPASPQLLQFRSDELEFDAFFFFMHQPATGPLPRRCFTDPDPLSWWPRFTGPFLSFTPMRGSTKFGYSVPAGIRLPLPFFAIGLDTRTFKWQSSAVETIVFDVPWKHVNVDVNNPLDPHCKAVGDIDGDGFVDALAASSRGGAGLFWYDAKAGFKKHRITTGNFSVDMQVADIDGDGDLDAVVPGITAPYVLWYENPLPNGNPRTASWRPHLIGRNTLTHDIEVGDIDGDGDVDVVTREKRGTSLRLFLNQGSGWKEIPIHKRGGEGTALGDIDGDGDLDIAHGGYWVETPSNPATGQWKVRTFATGWPLDVGVSIADINQDGRADILLAPSESANGRLVWYEGPVNPRTGTWAAHTIAKPVSYMHTFKTGDVDGDGDPDIVTAEMHQSTTRRVMVHYNHDRGASWTTGVLATTGSHNLRIADFDADGDLDVYGANWNEKSPTSASIELWRNQLDGYRKPRLRLDRWARRVIDAARPWRAVFVDSADINGDKLPDVVAGGFWYANPGRPSGVWKRRAFGGILNNVAAVRDFDGDGDPDVVGTDGKVVGRTLSWARNDGKGGFTHFRNMPRGGGDFLQGVAVSRFSNVTPCQIALSWHTPIRGIELLTVPSKPSVGAWGLGRISNVAQDEALAVGDIDRDGDRDLLLGTKWLRNDGASWSAHTLNPTGGSPDRNLLVDVNRDGRLDAVVGFEASSALERVAWYEQPSNPTATWTEHVVSRVIGPMSLDAADFDNDGDIDLCVGEHDLKNPKNARLLVLENADGFGLMWRTHLVYKGDEHHDGAHVVDIDRDGDLDIVSTGWQNKQVVVYENLAR